MNIESINDNLFSCYYYLLRAMNQNCETLK